jgi:rhodanese-related sulfurtransferase
MMKKGIKNAYALLGGTAAWKNAGYPMEAEKPK